MKSLMIVATALAVGVGCGGQGGSGTATEEIAPVTSEGGQGGVQAPMFEVDPLWPKPLPNHWLVGSAIGVTVDTQDHIWVIHRQQSFNERTEIGAATDPPTSECCVPAPKRPGVRSGGQPGRTLGWAGGRLRLADLKPWHHGSITWTTSGSVATMLTTPTS